MILKLPSDLTKEQTLVVEYLKEKYPECLQITSDYDAVDNADYGYVKLRRPFYVTLDNKYLTCQLQPKEIYTKYNNPVADDFSLIYRKREYKLVCIERPRNIRQFKKPVRH